MRSITLGLALSLVGGIAMAQVAPAPAANPPGPNGTAQPMPPAPPSPPGGPAQQPAQQPAHQGDARGAPNMATATQGGPPEGMIVETPNGFYLVLPRPGGAPPPRLRPRCRRSGCDGAERPRLAPAPRRRRDGGRRRRAAAPAAPAAPSAPAARRQGRAVPDQDAEPHARHEVPGRRADQGLHRRRGAAPRQGFGRHPLKNFRNRRPGPACLRADPPPPWLEQDRVGIASAVPAR